MRLKEQKPLTLDINVEGLIDFFAYVFAVFLALADALGEQIFDLPVDGAKVVLCPRCDFFK